VFCIAAQCIPFAGEHAPIENAAPLPPPKKKKRFLFKRAWESHAFHEMFRCKKNVFQMPALGNLGIFM
jgi:hypothetical protein